jgi:membrane protease YdiL (CAAX protease family)
VEPLRLLGPLVLALVSATAVDQLMSARGLLPPGLREPGRRLLASLLLAGVLYLGVFFALGQVGLARAPPPTQLPPSQLFSLHVLFVAGLVGWLLLGFAGHHPPGRSLASVLGGQLGLTPARPLREGAIGLGLGLLTWPLLIACMVVVVAVLQAVGGQELVPQRPPPLVLWIAGLPAWLKLSVALSAGVVEEIFFRGFLQPRVGVGVSTLLFVLAHLSYDEPVMLVGVTVLSLVFAGLVWWRQNVWPAIAAHFLFDAVQLLVVIPWLLDQWPDGAKALGPLAGALLTAGGAPWAP